MTDEIDIDAFGFGPEVDLSIPSIAEEEPRIVSGAAIEEARAEQARAARVVNVTPPRMPVAVIFPSRTAGEGHVVTIVPNLMRCTCEAGQHDNACWATKLVSEWLASMRAP